MAVAVADIAGPVAVLLGLAIAGTAPSCSKEERGDVPGEPGVTETRASEMPTSSAGRGVACGPRGLPPDRHYVAEGLCARVMAYGQGALRGLAFAPNGDLFAVATDGEVRRYRDVDHDGIFAPSWPETTTWAKVTGGDDAHDCHFDGQDLYCTSQGRVVRWHTTPEAEHDGPGEDVVAGIPTGGRHHRHPLGVWDGHLYVARSSADAVARPMPRSYDTNRGVVKRFPLSQYVPARPFDWKDGEVFATGLRNVSAIAREPSGRIVAIDDVPDVRNADAPEPVHVLEKDHAYGWPFCTYGRGGMPVARDEVGHTKDDAWCASSAARPVSLLPAHSAAMAIAFPNGARFALPSKWSGGGAFVAMNGSPDGTRAAGHTVVWLPLAEKRELEVVFGGGRDGVHRDGAWSWKVGEASDDPVRPVSLAISPADGGLYVSSDGGAIYRIAILGR